MRRTLQDLRAADCRILTLGQYLQPSPEHLPVVRYVPPEEFENWRTSALEMGFAEVASGPFVRSSYHAGEILQRVEALIALTRGRVSRVRRAKKNVCLKWDRVPPNAAPIQAHNRNLAFPALIA